MSGGAPCTDAALEVRYLAAVLHRPEAMEQAPVALDALSVPQHQTMLGALMALRARREDVTPSGVQIEIERQGRRVPESLFLSIASTLELDPHACAKRLRELHAARTLRSKALRAVQLAEAGSVLEARSELAAVAYSDDASDDPVLTFRELLTAAVEVATTRDKTERFVRMGTASLDDVFRAGPGDLVVLGAATNTGKSTMLMTWAMSLARRGVPVGILSIEDGAEDFGAKGLSAISGLDSERLWSGGGLTREDLERAMRAVDKEADLPISFARIRSRGIDAVISRMAYMARVRGARIICVDYLQAIRHRDVGSSTREKVNDSLATLMAAAAQLDVTLVLASQLKRNHESSKFTEPSDSDLKESGDIENSAQCIVLLWRETDDEADPRFGVIYGKIAKVKRAAAGRRFWLRRDAFGLLAEQGGPAPRKAKGSW